MDIVVKFAVVIVLVLSSVTPSRAATTPPSGGAGGGGAGGDAHSMPCIQKLMPCQPYLHLATNTQPPATCCMPLKQIVENDVKCLCAVFNNVDMLRSLNLTKENSLVLPKACGANADISQCKTSTGDTPPSTSTGTPMAPPASSTGSGSTGDSESSTTKPASSAPAISFVGLSFVSVFVATLFF